MGQRVFLKSDSLEIFLNQVLLASGVSQQCALHVAKGLHEASLRGVDSHGVRLLPHYISGVAHGRINPAPVFNFQQTSSATLLLDADHGFGHAAGVVAMEHAIAIAGDAGVGVVSVRNSSHCGALAGFSEIACGHGMLGFAATHATPKVRSPGGNRPFIGINPISISAPMESEDPLTFDSAPTAFSNNKVKQYAEDGLPLPQGVGADAMGMPTINANDVEMLLPIGDYKGFGLAILVELLCGFLSGMPVGPKVSAMYGNSLSEKRYLSQFYMAIDIKRFVDVASFEARLKSFVETLRSEPL